MCNINTIGLWTSGMNMIYMDDSDKAARPVSHCDHNKKNAAGVTKYICIHIHLSWQDGMQGKVTWTVQGVAKPLRPLYNLRYQWYNECVLYQIKACQKLHLMVLNSKGYEGLLMSSLRNFQQFYTFIVVKK
jgi:hypothetical protein